jgi:HK97 family phage portal protein
MGIFSNFIGRVFGRQQLPVYFTEGHDGTRSTLSEEDAMRVATIYACVRIISEDIGTLPLHIKTRTESGKGKVQNGHPVARLMRRPNPYMNGIDFRCALIASLELYGNSYAIVRERDKRGYATRLDLLDPKGVTPVAGDIDLYYSVAGISELVPSRDMVHIKGYAPDGIEGKSPVRMHQDLIENFINATKFSKKLYKNDLRSAAVFSLDGVLLALTVCEAFNACAPIHTRAGGALLEGYGLAVIGGSDGKSVSCCLRAC